MRIGFYEDRDAGNLSPLALARPVFELVCGRSTLRERVLLQSGATEWGAFVRGYLVDTHRETHPDVPVNEFDWLSRGPTLLVNGRWLPTADGLQNIHDDEVGVLDGIVVYLTVDPLEAASLTGENWEAVLAYLSRSRRTVRTEGELIRHPWDLVNLNAEQLRIDHELQNGPTRPAVTYAPVERFGPHVVVSGPHQDVTVDSTVTLDPFVVLDATRGPISIDAGAAVHSFTRIEGPCHIGCGSRLFRAHIRAGTTIGPECRVGGEIEASILHGYVNKYHTGFLGHSYICPWVNLGALTTSSDLKNDYSDVQIPLTGEMIETGLTKVGCFVGDHSKTALGSLFNTGTSVGVMSMVLPDGELLPKHIPSFTQVRYGRLTAATDVDRLFETAQATMSRRNCGFTTAETELFRFLHEETRRERDHAVARHRKRRQSRQSTAPETEFSTGHRLL